MAGGTKQGPGRIDESIDGLLKAILLEVRVQNCILAEQSGGMDIDMLRTDIAAQLNIVDNEI